MCVDGLKCAHIKVSYCHITYDTCCLLESSLFVLNDASCDSLLSFHSQIVYLTVGKKISLAEIQVLCKQVMTLC